MQHCLPTHDSMCLESFITHAITCYHMESKTFFGTYPVRSLNGRGEMGIHLPAIFTGMYGIYSEDNGEIITLIRMGNRKKKVNQIDGESP